MQEPSRTPDPAPETSAPPDSSAIDALGPFFAAVDEADNALAEAAAAVNDSFTGDKVTFTAATVDLVNQARPSAVAATIPAGLDQQVDRAVLLVYSDLESRFAALHGELCVHVGTYSVTELSPNCFIEGHTAAMEMAADIAAARTAASSASAFVDAGAHSREAAEVAARVRFVDGNNEGCGSVGGYRATAPIAVYWNSDPTNAASAVGQVNGVQVDARWTGDGWSMHFLAC